MKITFKKVLATIAAGAISTFVSANVTPPDSTLRLIKDDPIVAALDSLAVSKILNSADFCPSASANADDTAPYFDEATYRKRMAKLDAQSPFDLVYNDAVRAYIDLYAVKKRKVSQKMLGLAQGYFPLFEDKLAQFNLPLELKYLAIVESALNPTIRSRVGATGLWQFMYGTGKLFNLNTTSYVDDRCDPYKSTVAACRYFTYLYGIYKDWSLVLAAYNSGPGNVNKAIRRSGGGRTYWEIRPYLPQETQGYVPAFIAVNYVMNYADEHNLKAIIPPISRVDMDTVHVNHEVSLKNISDILDVPYEDLRYLNPSYIIGVIPYTGEPSTLVLPRQKIAAFINNERAIYDYADRAKPSRNYSVPSPVNGKPTTTDVSTSLVRAAKYHKVKKGESLGTIASRYHVTTTQIRKWNGMRSSTVHSGQTLVVKPAVKAPATTTVKPEDAPKSDAAPTDNTNTDKKADGNDVDNKDGGAEPVKTTTNTTAPKTTTPKTTTPATTSAKKYTYYTVKRGDSLFGIAGKYKVNVNDLKKWNNLKSNNLQAGQKLKIQTR
jgi:membrane-bound lytic murein transglycosylase D